MGRADQFPVSLAQVINVRIAMAPDTYGQTCCHACMRLHGCSACMHIEVGAVPRGCCTKRGQV